MKPSLGQRALAVLVLVVVAVLAFRLVLGVISAVFWIVATIVLILAALWAVATLRAGARDRGEKRRARQVQAAPPPDPVEAEMRKIREQLREQGRG